MSETIGTKLSKVTIPEPGEKKDLMNSSIMWPSKNLSSLHPSLALCETCTHSAFVSLQHYLSCPHPSFPFFFLLWSATICTPWSNQCKADRGNCTAVRSIGAMEPYKTKWCSTNFDDEARTKERARQYQAENGSSEAKSLMKKLPRVAEWHYRAIWIARLEWGKNLSKWPGKGLDWSWH